MGCTFKTVRGMRDLLFDEAAAMRYVEGEARGVAKLYGYKEVITPILEPYELLAAKAGEEIRLRMYVFEDLGGRKVALRPEFTASMARLVATVLRNEPKPLRLFCVGSLYRYDEPQKGRFREFWQSNYELMGSGRPEADVEVMMLTKRLMESVGLKNVTFKVGHTGVLRGVLNQEGVDEGVQNKVMQLMDKKRYDEALKLVEGVGASDRCLAVFKKLVTISGDVWEVLSEMRRQVEGYAEAVKAVSNLSDILKLLIESCGGLNVAVDAGFARGLEYYTGAIFEVYVPELEVALGAGGRYDNLVELFGGEPTPAVGVAHGIDRIVLAMREQGAQAKAEEGRTVMVIPVDEALRDEALRVSERLRAGGVNVEAEVVGRGVSKALEDADRRGVGYVIIVGSRELEEGAVVVRDLRRREQSIVKIEDVAKAVRR